MKQLLFIGLVFIFLAGCAGSNLNTPDSNQPEINTQGGQGEQPSAPEENIPTADANCYGPEIHPVGQSIAEQFEEETSYNQVMVWFCNGAIFDDILTALQTEKLSGEPADALLQMQAGGLTWDQIWTEIGLTEE